ncbi:MAG: hypothetical protein V4850_16500 [Myxococcota bacterium]
MDPEASSSLKTLLITTLTAWWAVGFFVVLEGATDEPYTHFDASDALTQVGLASGLLALAPVWAALLAWGLRRRLLSWAWGALVAPLVIGVFYLSFSPLGYVSDVERFVRSGP